jgi:hypothetical protein
MRKIFLPCFKTVAMTLVSAIGFFSAQAQFVNAKDYPFTASSKTFNYLQGGTAVTFTSYDDQYIVGIPIGFPFTFCGVTYTTVTAQTNGFMSFGNWTNYTYPASLSGLQYTGPCLIAGWHDASGSSASATPVTYITTGTSPNRVFTLEFKNWGTYPFTSYPSYITYQYILYEGGPLEVMYKVEGSGSFGMSGSTTAIGIAKNQTDWQSLNNCSANPVSSSTVFTTFTSQKPATGQSYLWGLIPCTDTPKYPVVGDSLVCPKRAFNLSVGGTSIISGLSYQWQYSKNGSTWSNFIGNVSSLGGGIVDSIIADTWYRVKITCSTSGISYWSKPFLVRIAPFYHCYCKDAVASVTTGLDIGNVKVEYMPSVAGATIPNGPIILNNGNAIPMTGNATANKTYTSFQQSLPPVGFYRDSAYKFSISAISSSSALPGSAIAVFVDFDRDGTYGTGEKVMEMTTPVSGTAAAIFSIPPNAEMGLTGMRVIATTAGMPIDPCKPYTDGETEDYVAEIKWEPCYGAVNAGKVDPSDTSVCKDYDYIVFDTTYERRKSNMATQWMISADNKLWFDVAAGAQKDTLVRIFNGQPVYYKFRATCLSSNDTTYTAPVRVNLKAPYKCYCFSQAVGGRLLDSSDVGGFSLGNVVTSDGGTHLQNIKAIRKRTDHTDEAPIEMYVDSTYRLTVFHTMWTQDHGDAKVTLFMDFNNDHMYKVPDGDRVYLGYTSYSTFTLIDNLTVPPIAIRNVPTGLRIILNNDIGPNIPSDEACGVYTSGETEDYMIVFKDKNTGITPVNDANQFWLYPNPTTGKCMLVFNGENVVKDWKLNITDVTGRIVITEMHKASGNFSKEIDMSGHSKGVYFVELTSGTQKTVRKLVVN